MENNMELPRKYIELFAKYLVAGSPLEPLLLSVCGNYQMAEIGTRV